MILCLIIPILVGICVGLFLYYGADFMGIEIIPFVFIFTFISGIFAFLFNASSMCAIHSDFQPMEGQKPISTASTEIVAHNTNYYVEERISEFDTDEKIYSFMVKNPDGSYTRETLYQNECKVIYKKDTTPTVYCNTYKMPETFFFWDFINNGLEDRYIIQLENPEQLEELLSSNWREP